MQASVLRLLNTPVFVCVYQKRGNTDKEQKQGRQKKRTSSR